MEKKKISQHIYSKVTIDTFSFFFIIIIIIDMWQVTKRKINKNNYHIGKQ
jgi:hypothetical protein